MCLVAPKEGPHIKRGRPGCSRLRSAPNPGRKKEYPCSDSVWRRKKTTHTAAKCGALGWHSQPRARCRVAMVQSPALRRVRDRARSRAPAVDGEGSPPRRRRSASRSKGTSLRDRRSASSGARTAAAAVPSSPRRSPRALPRGRPDVGCGTSGAGRGASAQRLPPSCRATYPILEQGAQTFHLAPKHFI